MKYQIDQQRDSQYGIVRLGAHPEHLRQARRRMTAPLSQLLTQLLDLRHVDSGDFLLHPDSRCVGRDLRIRGSSIAQLLSEFRGDLADLDVRHAASMEDEDVSLSLRGHC